MNLGRVDRLDVDGLLRLAAWIRRHFGDGDGDGGLTDGVEAGLASGAAPMAVADARPIGTAWLLNALWTRLEVADLLNLEVDVLLFFRDTTSTYFQRDTEDHDEPDQGEGAGRAGFRRFGKSKEHRDDLPQIVIGLAVTRSGMPVRYWCWPGNTQDQTLLAEVKDDLRAWKLGRVITVVDRGFSGADNLACLRRAGGHDIAGMRMRDGNPLVEAARQAATSRSATTCGSRKSAWTAPTSGLSSATTPTRRSATRQPRRGDRADPGRAGADQGPAGTRPDAAAQRQGTWQGRDRSCPGGVRAARPPDIGPVDPPAAQRAAGHRPRQGQGRATAGRQVPAGHLGS
jgi:hypothetical protein